MRPRSLRLLPLLLLALVAAGCARRETPAETAIAERTLLVTNPAEPSTLDPHLVTAGTEFDLVAALFEGLCVLDERTSRPAPAAAARWEVSADGLTYTFHLRPDARWSDGAPVTARDFVESWRRALAPGLGAENAYLLYPLRHAEAINAGRADAAQLGAEAVDDRTLRLTLERPTPHLPALTALPVWFPVRLAALAPHGPPDRRTTDWTRPGRLVGNGPFTLEEWTPDARLVVARNPHYWDAAAVRLERIRFLTNPSAETGERAFRAGQVHVTGSLPPSRLETWRAERPDALREDPFLQSIFLRFNTTRAPFADPRVRRALALAIDRDAIAARVLRGGRRPARSLTPPDTGGYTARAAVPTDFAAARRLLAEAGFPGGKGFPALELQVRNDQDQPRVAEVLQARWREELGITVTLAQVEQKTWIRNQQTLDYALSTGGWIGDFVDPVTFLGLFVSGGGNNWTGWGDAAYDDLLARAAATADPAARLALFQQAEARLLEQAPVAPLFFGARNFLVHPAVRGWESSLLGQQQYKKVYLAAP
jgi:oligopeptide transport system substrate-binding protein